MSQDLSEGGVVSVPQDRVRKGGVGDAAACAAIKCAWIDEIDWMPALHEQSDVAAHYGRVFSERCVFVIGDPVEAYLALDPTAGEVTSLFCQRRNAGLGKALLDRAKAAHPVLELWTFKANEGARRFYAREGFREVGETDGENEEGLPDVRLRWERAPIRMAGPADAATCARIVSDWVRRTPWIEARFSESQLTEMIAKAMPEREIYLVGEPVAGYLSLDPKAGQIGALYVDHPGEGLGKALLDRAKDGRAYLKLNTHEPNHAAHRFYRREGFEVVAHLGQGDDGVPELQMEWRA